MIMFEIQERYLQRGIFFLSFVISRYNVVKSSDLEQAFSA
jgi:hypothetical protein